MNSNSLERERGLKVKDPEEKKSAVMVYPCPWKYQIIGADEDSLRRAVGEVIQDRTYRMVLSRQSEKGKYQSFQLEVVVESEGHRLAVYESLQAHPAVKIVL
jgi:putative lipoic acid-binding regulatory protein